MAGTAYINGLGVFLPGSPVSNDDIEQVLGRVNDRSSQVKRWILEQNGIESRYYAIDRQTGLPTHTNAQMTAEAVRSALKQAGVAPDQIECLACGTSSADQVIPSHASMVHGELACPPCEAASTTGVCCSGMSALKYGYMNVVSGMARNAVVAGSELASISLRAGHFRREMELKLEELQAEPMLAFENEFLRWMLSDGAGAALIEGQPRGDRLSLRIDWVDLVSYANAAETCMYFGGIKRPDGTLEGFRAVDDPNVLFRDGYLSLAQDVRTLRNCLPVFFKQACLRARDRHQLRAEEIDWVLPHYSSEAFRQPLQDGLTEEGVEFPVEKWFTNLKWKGNTGSASIYIILEELLASGRAREGDRILCVVPESARFSFSLMHLTAVC
jgi:3-oxoacyl-[acyl-carrier-protein] synthase-3